MTIYPARTDIREIAHFDRSEKVTFYCESCAAEKGISVMYRSKDPFVSQWFPANKLTSDAEYGIVPMPCPHTLKTGTWVTAFEYADTL